MKKPAAQRFTKRQWEWLSEWTLPDGFTTDFTPAEARNRRLVYQKLQQLQPKP